jgi:rSAM/selenodomain-associated transferase 1
LNKSAIIIFGKSPCSKSIKTRLAKSRGNEFARSFYFDCLEHVIAELETLPSSVEKFLFTEGVWEKNSKIGKSTFDIRPQVEGDLTAKILHAVGIVFDEGFSSVTILGSDTPDLSSDLVLEAIKLLEKYDIVVGPNFDGGFYLLTQKKLEERIFQNLAWSTSEVFTKVIQNTKQLKLKMKAIRSLYDIDNENDLRDWLSQDENKSSNLLKEKYRKELKDRDGKL